MFYAFVSVGIELAMVLTVDKQGDRYDTKSKSQKYHGQDA